MSVTSHIFWFLCAFGSVALAAVPARTPVAGMVAASLGLAVGLRWLSPQQAQSLEPVGALIALAAAWRLCSSRAAVLAAVVAGVASAAWIVSLRSVGMPVAPAIVIGAVPALLAAYFTAARPSFAPPLVRDEALLIAVALGLIAAVLPGMLDGWRSAEALNMRDKAEPAAAFPAWLLAFVGGLAGLGGVHTWWKRA